MAEKTTVVNIRLPEIQARWLRNLADAEHGGNLSAAARKALSDGWMMRRCRDEYRGLVEEGLVIPPNEDGTTRGIQLFLSSFGAKTDLLWNEDADADWV